MNFSGYSNAPRKSHLLHVLAWPVYLAIWAAIHLIDYKMRDPESLLVGGADSPLFGILYLVSLANFVVMIIMGTEMIRGVFLRGVIVLVHVVAVLWVSYWLMIYYAVGVLGDTI